MPREASRYVLPRQQPHRRASHPLLSGSTMHWAACHPTAETSFEHTVELRGITFNSSLQAENSDYYRVLTPALERLVS